MVHARSGWVASLVSVIAIVAVLVAPHGTVDAGKRRPDATGTLTRSQTVVTANCLPKAKGQIKLFKQGAVERMVVSVSGMPKNSNFDVFVIQAPNAPFGLSWYQGDLHTGSDGTGSQTFLGRFSIETFIVAPGSQPAPVVHPGDDAATNPVTAPVHTFHVGLWFDSLQAQQDAGCGGTVETPFNGDHTAGAQVLTTVPVTVNINGTDQVVGPLAKIQ